MSQRRKIYAVARFEVAIRIPIPGAWPDGASRTTGLGAAFEYAESVAATIRDELAQTRLHGAELAGVETNNVYLCSGEPHDEPCSNCHKGDEKGPILPTPYGPFCLQCLVALAFLRGDL